MIDVFCACLRSGALVSNTKSPLAVKIKLWNKEGKKVFSINEYGTSKKSVPIVGGIPIMKTDKLLPLCESASEKLVADLEKKIGKVAKKSAKKL